jgi:hypothetical protein
VAVEFWLSPVSPQLWRPPLIISLDQGSTGQILVSVKPVARARRYDVRYAPDPAAGAAINWTTTSAACTKPAILINNLTRGVNYAFQVRAFGTLGFSGWSSPVERMCI